MTRMSICPGVEQWQRFLCGQLEEHEALHLERHLSSCPVCLATVRELPEAPDSLADDVRARSTPDEAVLSETVQHLIERLKGAPAAAENGSNLTQSEPAASGLSTAAPAEDADSYDFLAPPVEPGDLGRLGSYRVLRVLGKGGMGVVFQARDPDLERYVALKAMKPALAASDSARRRFLREARATAALEHDNIVHIHQVAEDRGIPYLAMPMLRGETLDDRLRRTAPLRAAEVMRVGREVAEGLQAAHQAGLIHRDVKPSNIWLEGERGRVKILDFGLARAEADGSQLTQTGAVAGTPEYMAPEQAQGEKVDARSDLFSLGCVMYRMCTGVVPFKGKNTMSLLLSLAQEQTKPPHERNPETPLALSSLILRLLAKDAKDRPASAREVIEAIEAIERERTRPVRVEEKVQENRDGKRGLGKGSGRRWAALAAAAVFLAATTFAASLVLQTKDGTLTVTTTEPDVKVLVDGEEKIVIDSRKAGKVELRPGPHRMSIKRGDEELFTETFTLKSGGIEVIHAEWKPAPKEIPLRKPSDPLTKLDAGKIPADERFAWQPKELVAVAGTHARRHFTDITSLAWSPDGKTIAAGGVTSNLLSFFHADTLRRRVVGDPGAGSFSSLAFSPDGRSLAAAAGPALRMIDLGTPESKFAPVLAGQGLYFHVVARAPKGELLAAGLLDGTVRFYEASGTALKPSAVLKAHDGPVASLSFASDGKTLASLGRIDETVCLYDTGRPVPAKRDEIKLSLKPTRTHWAVALSQDGKTLAVGDPLASLRLWDLADGKPRERALVAPAEVLAKETPTELAFSPDGRTVAVARAGGLLLWDVAGEPSLKAFVPEPPVRAVAFSPDGKTLAVGSGCTLRLLDVTRPKPVERFDDHDLAAGVTSIVVSEGQQPLVLGARDGTARYWELASGQPRQRVVVPFGVESGTSVTLPPSGKPVAVLWGGPTGGVYDLRDRAAKLRESFGKFATKLSADGDTLLLLSGTNLRVWDLRRDKPAEQTLQGVEMIQGYALSADGKIIVASQKDKVRVWDRGRAGAPSRLLAPAVGDIKHLALSPDGKTLLLTGSTPGLHVWSLTAGPVVTLPGSTGWHLMTFSPDGKTLAAFDAYRVYLWDTATWQLRHRWDVPHGSVEHLAFLGEGRHFAIGNRNGTAYILRLPAPNELAPAAIVKGTSPLDRLEASKIPADEHVPELPTAVVAVAGTQAGRHFSMAQSVAWSPDGKWLASGGMQELVVRLWDAATMRRVATIPHRGSRLRVAFSGDGMTLAVGSVNPSGVQLLDVTASPPKAAHSIERQNFGANRVAASTSRDNPILALHYVDGRIVVYRLGDKPTEKTVLQIPKGDDVSLTLSADGKTLATAGPDDKVRLWELSAAGPLERGILEGFAHQEKYVALSADGKSLVLAEAHLNPRLWDLSGDKPKPRPVVDPPRAYRSAQCVAFSPDGRLVAVGTRLHIDLWAVGADLRWKATMRGHAGPVSGVAFSPDGRRLASCGQDGTVRQWDLSGESPTERFPPTQGHHGAITSLHFTPGDRELVSAGRDGVVRTWAVDAGGLRELNRVTLEGMAGSAVAVSRGGEPRALAYAFSNAASLLWSLRDGTGKPAEPRVSSVSGAVAFSSDGRRLAYCWNTGQQRQIDLIDLTAGPKKGTPIGRMDGDLNSLVFSPDGKWLAGGRFVKGDPIHLWNLSEWPPPTPQKLAYPGTLNTLAFSPDSRTLVAGGVGGDLQLWDVGRPRVGTLSTVPTGSYPIALAFSPDARLLACANNVGEVLVHDTADAWRVRHRWALPYGSGAGLTFAHDGRHLAAGSATGRIFVLRLPDAAVPGVAVRPADAHLAPAGPLDRLDAAQIPKEERFDFQPKELVAVAGTHKRRHFAPINYLAVSPDGKSAVVGISGLALSVFDTATLERQRVVPVDTNAIAFGREPGALYICQSNAVVAWKLTSPLKEISRKNLPVHIETIAITPVGDHFATGARDGVVRLWEATTGKELLKADLGAGRVLALAFSADGKTLAGLGGAGPSLLVWSVDGAGWKKKAIIPLVESAGRHYRFVALSPDGKTLALGEPTQQTMLRLWDLAGPEPKERSVNPPKEQIGTAWSLAFSPDGQTMAQGCTGGFALWDVTGEPRVKAHAKGPHSCVAFLPDGKTLITGGADCAIRSWDVTGPEPKERLPLGGQYPLGRITSISSLPADGTLVTAGGDDRVRYWDLRGTGPKELASVPLPNPLGLAIALPARGLPVAVNHRLWDLSGWKANDRGQVHADVLAEDASTAGFSARTKLVQVWNLRELKPTRRLVQSDVSVGVVALSAEGRWLASSEVDKVRLTSLANPSAPPQVIEAKVGGIHGLAFSPDARLLVVNGSEHRLQVFDLGDGAAKEVANLPARYHLRSLTFSPDGKYLVGASSQEGVIVWDATTWRQVYRHVMTNVVSTAAFVGDNRHLALGNVNGTVYILRLPSTR